MENKSHAMLAGLFTIALLLAAIAGGLWLNSDRADRVPYELATKLSVPGLNPQATVRYRGLDVGRVERISFDPQVPGQILVHMMVLRDTPVTRSTYATLGYQGVTGIAYVDLNDDGSNPVRVSTSPTNVTRIELRPGLLTNLENRGLAILEQVDQITRRLNGMLSDENQQTMVRAVEDIGQAAREFKTIPRQLAPTLKGLPVLASEAREAVQSVTRLSRDLSGLTSALQASNGPLDRFGKTADEIAGVADRFERDLLPLTTEFRSTLRLFNRTLENVNDRPQSLLFGTRGPDPGPGEYGFTPPNH